MRISGLFYSCHDGGHLILMGYPEHAQLLKRDSSSKKEGRWEYYSSEDPGLKYLYLKGTHFRGGI